MAVAESSSGVLVYSTIPEVNELWGIGNVRAPIMKYRKLDNNLDGIVDDFIIKVALPMAETETLNRISLLLFFDLMVQERIQLKMETLLYTVHESSYPGKGLEVTGSLRLNQVTPIRGNFSDYQGDLLNSTYATSYSDVTPAAIVARSALRNVTTLLEQSSVVWLPGTPSGTYNVTLRVRVPDQPIRYIPKTGEMLKWAWVQFVPLLLLVYCLLEPFRWFVFRYQVVPTRVTVDAAPPNKLHLS